MAETAVSGGAVKSAPESDVPLEPSRLPLMNESVLASLNVDTSGGLGRSTPIQIPVVLAATDDAHVLEHAEIPDYVRQQWERRGYKVSLERRFLFAKLADGQKVVVPVDQLRVNPLPIHVN